VPAAPASTPPACRISSRDSSSLSAATRRTSRGGSGRSATRSANVRSSRSVNGRPPQSLCSSSRSRAAAGSSSSASGISGRLVQDPRAHSGRKLRLPRAEQLGGRSVVKAVDAMLRQPRLTQHRRVPVTSGDEQHDGIGLDPASDERKDVCSRPIKPVRVLDDREHRRIAGDVRNQVKAPPRRSGTARAPPHPSTRTRHQARPAEPRTSPPHAPAPAWAAGEDPQTADAPRTASPAVDSTVTPRPRAACAASDSNRDLPIPGSPRRTPCRAWPHRPGAKSGRAVPPRDRAAAPLLDGPVRA
jgi:hypothetical protein